jgi:hypothetical protein
MCVGGRYVGGRANERWRDGIRSLSSSDCLWVLPGLSSFHQKEEAQKRRKQADKCAGSNQRPALLESRGNTRKVQDKISREGAVGEWQLSGREAHHATICPHILGLSPSSSQPLTIARQASNMRRPAQRSPYRVKLIEDHVCESVTD